MLTELADDLRFEQLHGVGEGWVRLLALIVDVDRRSAADCDFPRDWRQKLAEVLSESMRCCRCSQQIPYELPIPNASLFLLVHVLLLCAWASRYEFEVVLRTGCSLLPASAQHSLWRQGSVLLTRLPCTLMRRPCSGQLRPEPQSRPCQTRLALLRASRPQTPGLLKLVGLHYGISSCRSIQGLSDTCVVE